MSNNSPASREEIMAALFANLVVQQTNMALMFLGRMPNPESGQRVQNLDAARMFIDQLEMIEFKTRGNLDTHEEQLLKESLTTLRMAFVEAVESAPSGEVGKASPAAAQPAAAASGQEPAPSAEPGTASEEEHRKKFSKKY